MLEMRCRAPAPAEFSGRSLMAPSCLGVQRRALALPRQRCELRKRVALQALSGGEQRAAILGVMISERVDITLIAHAAPVESRGDECDVAAGAHARREHAQQQEDTRVHAYTLPSGAAHGPGEAATAAASVAAAVAAVAATGSRPHLTLDETEVYTSVMGPGPHVVPPRWPDSHSSTSTCPELEPFASPPHAMGHVSSSTASAGSSLIPGSAFSPGYSQQQSSSTALTFVLSSFDDMGVLSSTASFSGSSMDSDAEMCVLLADAAGDVQMVCDSDPTHPVSLAEEAVLHPVVPTTLLQDIERKLEGDIVTVLWTILFAVGFILLEFGISDLIDIFYGESVLPDLVCIGAGLAVVFWAKLSNVPLIRLDKWQ